MAKNRCGRLGKIAKRVKTSGIECCRYKIKVTIEVTPKGNRCTKVDCPYNKGLVDKQD
jgi:hypothetical protein